PLRDAKLHEGVVRVGLRARDVRGGGDGFSRQRRRRPDDAEGGAAADRDDVRPRPDRRVREGASAAGRGEAGRGASAARRPDRLTSRRGPALTMDMLVDLGLPGLVFLGLSFWLVRKVARAARTERDLEGERLEGALAEELREGKARAAGTARAPEATQPRLEVVTEAPPEALRGADLRGADLEHVALVAEMIRAEGEPRAEVLWVRS